MLPLREQQTSSSPAQLLHHRVLVKQAPQEHGSGQASFVWTHTQTERAGKTVRNTPGQYL